MKPTKKTRRETNLAEYLLIITLIVVLGFVVLVANDHSPSNTLDDAPREAVHGTNMDEGSRTIRKAATRAIAFDRHICCTERNIRA